MTQNQLKTNNQQLKYQPMRYLFLLGFLGLWACQNNASQGATTGESNETATLKVEDSRTRATRIPIAKVKKPDCNPGPDMQVLEDNSIWNPENAIMLFIGSDAESADPELGESHRVLLVMDQNCKQIDRQLLPVDVSPDFPYYFANINYNNTSQIIAIQGPQAVYCYNLASKTLLPRLEPQFLTERDAVDAQSGQIQRLELWEDYLIGFAQDYGAFAFDLSNTNAPKPILPIAEVSLKEGGFNSLFTVNTGNQKQVLVPTFDYDSNQFSINPIFENPLTLERSFSQTGKQNQLVILREEGTDQAIAVDLFQQKKVPLPQ